MTMNLHNAEFIKSAPGKSGFIRDGLPMIAFAGRSNAGKSSTINAILGRKSLARVSESPGKTIHVNYYLIDKELYLVDLPGYGFARTAKSRKEDWGTMMDDYFAETENITLCVLIVDARHTPSDEDCMMCDYLKETGVPFVVAANKVDSVKKSELSAKRTNIVTTLEIDDSIPFLFYSARLKTGIEEFKNLLFTTEETSGI